MSIYEAGLEQNQPITPAVMVCCCVAPRGLSNKPAVIQNDRVLNWGEVFQRCQRSIRFDRGWAEVRWPFHANTAEMFRCILQCQ